jgi:hypothetical protein
MKAGTGMPELAEIKLCVEYVNHVARDVIFSGPVVKAEVFFTFYTTSLAQKM